MKTFTISISSVLFIVMGLSSCTTTITKQPLPESRIYIDYFDQDKSLVIETLGEPDYANTHAVGGGCLTYSRPKMSMLFDFNKSNRITKVTYSTGSKSYKKDIRSKVMELHGNGQQWNIIEQPSKPWLANKSLVMELADHSRLIYEDKVNLTVSSVDKL